MEILRCVSSWVTIDWLDLTCDEVHAITSFEGSPDCRPASSQRPPQAVQPKPGRPSISAFLVRKEGESSRDGDMTR